MFINFSYSPFGYGAASPPKSKGLCLLDAADNLTFPILTSANFVAFLFLLRLPKGNYCSQYDFLV
jgi:hypothetical protein